jgi:hypothetical protein
MCGGLAFVVNCGQRADGPIEGHGPIDWKSSQIDSHGVGCDCDLVPGEGGDVFGALSEDDDQDRGEAVARMKCLLVCDLFDDGVLLLDRHAWGGAAAVRGDFQIRGDQSGLDGPSDESQDVFSGRGSSCLPAIDVGLGQLLDSDVVFVGQPIAELDGDGDCLFGSQEGGVGNWVHRAKPLFQAPSNEAGEHFSMFFGGDAQLMSVLTEIWGNILIESGAPASVTYGRSLGTTTVLL